jgi:hypothetical protein
MMATGLEAGSASGGEGQRAVHVRGERRTVESNRGFSRERDRRSGARGPR